MSTAVRITVRQAEQNYGPYSLDQVNTMIVAGRMDEQDLAWIEGAPTWQALGTVPGVVRVPPPLAPMRPADESERLVLPAFLLAFFLGVFGVHRFYVGKTGSGLVMLLLTITAVGLLVTGIWYLIDTIVIACGGFTDGEGKRLRRWV
ncbi:MAG: NINE protein [Planctomycetes bacterium]|nr:NINE protein [Planctomycetota bacterium]MCB9886531.1 NINE protein [Planctomycetota bacterium]